MSAPSRCTLHAPVAHAFRSSQATFYGVRASNIATVVVNKENSECLTLGGFTDFVKVEFTMTTTEGASVTVFADRCGGAEAMAIVSDSMGKVVMTSTLPDEELKAEVAKKMADFPDVMPYFWQAEADYRNLKERCAAMSHRTASKNTTGIAIGPATPRRPSSTERAPAHTSSV